MSIQRQSFVLILLNLPMGMAIKTGEFTAMARKFKSAFIASAFFESHFCGVSTDPNQA
jgi:hypothetical protein